MKSTARLAGSFRRVLPALMLSFIAATATVLGFGPTVYASGAAMVAGPRQLVPGSVARLAISGFPPGSHVRVQLGVAYNPPSNCCVSDVYPRYGRPAFVVSSTGSLSIGWPDRRPTMTACLALHVSSSLLPNNTRRYVAGERVEISVFTDSFGTGGPGAAFRFRAATIAHQAAPVRALSILVLGDSYPAGNGAGDYYGAKGCWRSHMNYGEDYARLVEAAPYTQAARATNAACSGRQRRGSSTPSRAGHQNWTR